MSLSPEKYGQKKQFSVSQEGNRLYGFFLGCLLFISHSDTQGLPELIANGLVDSSAIIYCQEASSPPCIIILFSFLSFSSNNKKIFCPRWHIPSAVWTLKGGLGEKFLVWILKVMEEKGQNKNRNMSLFFLWVNMIRIILVEFDQRFNFHFL